MYNFIKFKPSKNELTLADTLTELLNLQRKSEKPGMENEDDEPYKAGLGVLLTEIRDTLKSIETELVSTPKKQNYMTLIPHENKPRFLRGRTKIRDKKTETNPKQKNPKDEIILGKIYQDRITGTIGTAIGHLKYFGGYNQTLLVPRIKNDGKTKEAQWFYDPQLERVTDETIKLQAQEKPDQPKPKETER